MSVFAYRENWQKNVNLLFDYSLNDDITADAVVISDNLDIMCLDLEKMLIKELKIKWDVFTLEKYIDKKISPRGLRFTKWPTFDREKETFVKIWNHALDSFSFEMMRIVIKQRADTLLELDDSIKLIREKLEPFIGTEDFDYLSDKIKDKLIKIEQNIAKKEIYERP